MYVDPWEENILTLFWLLHILGSHNQIDKILIDANFLDCDRSQVHACFEDKMTCLHKKKKKKKFTNKR